MISTIILIILFTLNMICVSRSVLTSYHLHKQSVSAVIFIIAVAYLVVFVISYSFTLSNPVTLLFIPSDQESFRPLCTGQQDHYMIQKQRDILYCTVDWLGLRNVRLNSFHLLDLDTQIAEYLLLEACQCPIQGCCLLMLHDWFFAIIFFINYDYHYNDNHL